MEGRQRLIVLTLVLLLSALSLTCENHDQPIDDHSILNDASVISAVDENYEQSWTILAGHYYSIHINCITCSSSLAWNGQQIDENRLNYSGQASFDGLLTVTINNPNQENFTPSFLLNISNEYPHIRPAPGADFGTHEAYICSKANECIDSDSQLLTTKRDNIDNDTGRIISGVIDDEQSNYFGFNVTEDTTIELILEHTSDNLVVEAYYQNATAELPLGQIASSDTISNQISQPNAYFASLGKAGRIIVKVSSALTGTVWSLGLVLHQDSSTSTVELTNGLLVCGHDITTVIFANNETTAPTFTAIVNDVDYSYSSLVNTEWLYTGNGTIDTLSQTRIYSLPMSNAIRLSVQATVFCLEAGTETYSDGQSGNEAPSLPPILGTTDNSSWPRLKLDTTPTSGQFTLSIRDSSDVYIIEIDAWEDSVHFIMFEVIGDINQFEIELIEKSQEDWSDSQTKIRTAELGKLSVAMEVSRGSHFFRISLINNTFDNSWGEYTPPIEYSIVATYELVEEGEEPWFPPDDNAEKWGNVARWFMGLLFLMPALYLAISQIRKKNFARELLTKQQRLDWLKSRLDSGVSPKKSRKELAKSLDAVATLDWSDACQAWGKPNILYRTDNIAIAGWRLDDRITKQSGAWPIIIGTYIIKGNWEIAALRFDSPEGEPWEINSVTPRFLYSGYEIFLDTMNEGNKTFISVELVGNANSVDIELNGRMDGEPFACRVSKTLFRNEEEE